MHPSPLKWMKKDDEKLSFQVEQLREIRAQLLKTNDVII